MAYVRVAWRQLARAGRCLPWEVWYSTWCWFVRPYLSESQVSRGLKCICKMQIKLLRTDLSIWDFLEHLEVLEFWWWTRIFSQVGAIDIGRNVCPVHEAKANNGFPFSRYFTTLSCFKINLFGLAAWPLNFTQKKLPGHGLHQNFDCQFLVL